MKTKMKHAVRMEFANAIRGRYAAAATKDKRRIGEVSGPPPCVTSYPSNMSAGNIPSEASGNRIT